jgi:hypothetical protein
MRISVRLALLGCVSFTALAVVGSAWASYTPRLFATAATAAPGKPTAMILTHLQDVNDDPTAKDTIYVPLGYQLNLSQAVGTQIGVVFALVVLRNGGNAQVEVEGTVTVDSPANYPPASNTCTPGETHEAVWKLNVTIAGTPLTVPVYIDHITAGPETAFASGKLQICLAGPIGTPAGAQVVAAVVGVAGVFTNPPTVGFRLWRALFTPYLPGTPNPNPAGTVEGQSFSPSSVVVTITVKRLKHGVVVIQGRLMAQGRPVRGADIDLYSGRKKLGTKSTNSKGRFSFRKRIKRKTVFHAEAFFLSDFTGGCQVPSIAPAGCQTATISAGANSKSVTARPRR